MRYLSIFIVLFSIHSLFAGGFASLKLGVDARTQAMGLTTAVGNHDASAGFNNPGTLAALNGRSAVISLHRWFSDVQSEFAGFAVGNGQHALAFDLLFTGIGDLEHRVTPSEEPLGLFSAHEMIIGICYSRVVTPGLSIGLTLKALYEKIYVEDAWGMGGDLGVVWNSDLRDLRLGGVIQNMGKTAELQDDPVDLPLTLRIGAALPLTKWGGEWLIAVEGVQIKDMPFHFHTGVECQIAGRFALRGGVMSGYETHNITGGAGFVFRKYKVDYSYMPFQSGLGDSHRLSIRFHWQ